MHSPYLPPIDVTRVVEGDFYPEIRSGARRHATPAATERYEPRPAPPGVVLAKLLDGGLFAAIAAWPARFVRAGTRARRRTAPASKPGGAETAGVPPPAGGRCDAALPGYPVPAHRKGGRAMGTYHGRRLGTFEAYQSDLLKTITDCGGRFTGQKLAADDFRARLIAAAELDRQLAGAGIRSAGPGSIVAQARQRVGSLLVRVGERLRGAPVADPSLQPELVSTSVLR
jgi:hypothetical protein